MQLSLHAGRVQLHVLYNYDNINNTKTFSNRQLGHLSVVKSNYYYIFTIDNLLVYFILRYFSVYLSFCQSNFG